MKITAVGARQVFDSRGNPTVEARVCVGTYEGLAMVPSGASTGIHEAVELRDHAAHYHGLGVLNSVSNAKNIGRKLVGKSMQQNELDEYMIKMDGTSNKHRLGANTILAISLAFARACAHYNQIPLYRHIASLCGKKRIGLPVPAMNMLNGGKHAGTALDIQECLVYPVGKTFAQKMRTGSEIYHDLKINVIKRYGKQYANVGDEGGFAPPFDDILPALKFLSSVVRSRGRMGLDVAASSFFRNGHYILHGEKNTPQQLFKLYIQLEKLFDLKSIEDPFMEDDFENFSRLCEAMGKKCMIVGDDLLVSQSLRVSKAIKQQACNCLLLKVNQVGTLTEALSTAKLAESAGWDIMVSHRSGETEDAFIADLAVGCGAGYIKSGAPCRSERVAKYNRLLQIEEEL